MGLALGGGEVGGKESLTCALFQRYRTWQPMRCLVSGFETTRAFYRELGARKGRGAFKSAAGGERSRVAIGPGRSEGPTAGGRKGGSRGSELRGDTL